jgi:phage-related baseplate assembly protein
MNFDDLPKVLFVQVDTAQVESSIITMYEGITNTTLFPGDPVRLFLSTLAAVIAQQNAILDFTAKQNLLRYAIDAYLDHLGAWLSVYRLDAFPAKTILRFTLQEARPFAMAIPADTRATADGKIFFATDDLLTIPAGELSGEVAATCLEPGVIGNGLVAGQINRVVDTTNPPTTVENTQTSNGGSDVEDDDSLRNRIRLNPESYTTAGSELAYVFWALSAHGNIGDVSVISPLPGMVNVFVMLKGGGVPLIDSAEIYAVAEILNEKKHRPLTDFVAVYPINAAPVDYTVVWYIANSQGTQLTEIAAAIKQAVKDYEAWQTARAGRDIVPDRLIELCRGAGAKRITHNGLEFTNIDRSSVAQFIENPDRIVFGGVESE